MAARPIQPSEYEIQREVEALRDLRRRSTNPGALVIDPDLPNQSSPTWSPKSPTLKSPTFSSANADTDSIGSSEGSSSSDSGSRSTEAPNNPSDDPFHLFWVPASLHPEIAPAEFRAFLKEHARSPSDGSETSEVSASPSSLSPSSSLNRKRSMLSRQYRPKLNDGVEEENVVPLKRNRSILYPTNSGPQLTISDLQKLEELADEASVNDDPSRLRNVLRRSLSLNLSPSGLSNRHNHSFIRRLFMSFYALALNLMDNIPEMGDEADAPIIVPPPGQILRRTARTKIRKPGLPGDGGGHRFGSSRRVNTNPAPATDPRSSSEMSSSDHGEPDQTPGVMRRHTVSDDGSHIVPRPDSFSEEAIYDAYARDDDEDRVATVVVSPTALVEEEPILQQPQPQRLLMLPPEMHPSPVPGPSPSAPLPPHHPLIAHSPPITIPKTTSPPRKEKDKKGLFGKWGGDKGGKKGSKAKDRDDRVTATEKEKESGFFGSLFGKKKQDSDPSSITGGLSGREAAQALLGASKSSKGFPPSTSPGLAPGVDGNPYARYPIHVERAIYRLSHIKLANPRRPLYEQVLISNLMFWYLGVINKTQNPTPPTQPAQTTEGASNEILDDKDSTEKEREQREKEQREKFEKERLESERLEKEQRERELELKKKESGRRGTLNKMNSGTPPGGGRHAEMPVKGPQYEKQHRVMEQEYGSYNGQPPRGPTSLANGPPTQQHSRSPTPPQYGILGQQYQARPENNFRRPSLPPGAMAPVEQSSWMAQPSPQPRRPSLNALDPAGQHQSDLPPSQNEHGLEAQLMQLPKFNSSQESLGDRNDPRNPGRSLSVASTPPASVMLLTNGHVRKGKSAHAVMYREQRPHSEEQPPSGEEEDLPLAVWQRRRK